MALLLLDESSKGRRHVAHILAIGWSVDFRHGRRSVPDFLLSDGVPLTLALGKIQSLHWIPMKTESIFQITITGDGIVLDGILGIPEQPKGVIAFAHGSGSGRFSPRNQFVARVLEAGGFATLLLDLLTPDEADDRNKVFDIDLLADRLLLAQNWLQTHARTRGLRTGYFGASTGAGAALQAAARQPKAVGAVVSRGGRPDLAGPYLGGVTAPTLLLVGGDDGPVVGMNEEALAQLTCPKQLIIIQGATHLFEEPGTLEQVAQEALHWFRRYLDSEPRRAKESHQ